jgi:hypothetical protein
MGFKVTGISNEMDNSEDFMISDIDNGSGDDGSISSDSE